MSVPIEEYVAQGQPFRASAGVLIRDERGRPLVVQPTYKTTWEIPGGLIDPGEAPHQAAAREVREELGVILPIGRLLCVDHSGPSERNSHSMFHFILDGGVVDSPDEFTVAEDEIVRAVYLPTADAIQLLGPRVGARVGFALSALDERSALYLHNGALPSNGGDTHGADLASGDL